MPRFKSIGFMPEATALAPSRDDCLCEHRSGRRSVPGKVVGPGCDFAQHLRAHILELVLEFDFLGDGDAVLGDPRRTERLVDNDVTALRTEGYLYGIGQHVDTTQHALACVGLEFDFLRSHFFTP
jgi:hypothetical protein